MYKLLVQLTDGADNRIPYDMEVTQIIREPLSVLAPEKITNSYLQKNKIDISPNQVMESVDFAILTKPPFQVWDGKFSHPWILKQGTVLSVKLDDNTNALYLVSQILPAGTFLNSYVTRFKTFELTMNASTIIRFNEDAILHRIMFYDLFEYDAELLYWRPIIFDWDWNGGAETWITDAYLGLAAGTLQKWLEQTIKISAKFQGRLDYHIVDEYRKAQMVSGANEPNIVVIEAPVSNADEPYIYLSGDATVDWTKFKFYVLVEYSVKDDWIKEATRREIIEQQRLRKLLQK